MATQARNAHHWGVVGALWLDGSRRDVEYCDKCRRYRAGERFLPLETLENMGTEWL